MASLQESFQKYKWYPFIHAQSLQNIVILNDTVGCWSPALPTAVLAWYVPLWICLLMSRLYLTLTSGLISQLDLRPTSPLRLMPLAGAAPSFSMSPLLSHAPTALCSSSSSWPSHYAKTLPWPSDTSSSDEETQTAQLDWHLWELCIGLAVTVMHISPVSNPVGLVSFQPDWQPGR